MPELPEMETYRRLLSEKIVGKRITYIEVTREKSINVEPEKFQQELLGNSVLSIKRRAKYLLFQLENQKWLLLHLMLGGWLYVGTDADKPNRTFQVIISFGEQSLYFIGLRLGYLHIYEPAMIEEKLDKLGPEPLDSNFTEELFLKRLKRKTGRIKMTLLDQSFVSGIGNCYADEICFDAAILPVKKGKDLTLEEKKRLFRSIRTVLEDAIKNGGYMEQPLYQGDSFTGQFDEQCKVYDRGGEPCLRCRHPIVQEELSGRKVFYCQRCQR